MGKDRVLVVDDELDNRVMMRYFLESWGYEVELAANGQEALEKVNANAPDLVLLDLEMPVMNGFETCEKLKDNEATEQIPVIMFTGLEQTADKVNGIKRGADDYVVKTVDPEELQARIEMILRRSKRYEASPAAAPAPPNAGDGPDEHAVSGSLSELYFPETMQLILAYGKSGVLNLKDGKRVGRVYLKDGKVVHATLDQAEGEEAFYKLALWKSGHFSFQVGEGAPKDTINKSGTNLLIEATRRLDEWNMISSKIPSFDVAPERVPLSGADSIKLTRQDWKVILFMNGQYTVRQVAEKLGIDLFECGRVVFNLLTVGVLAIDTDSKKAQQYTQVPILDPNPKGEGPIQLSSTLWRIISLIDGKRSISDIAEMVGLPTTEVVKSFKELIGLGLVRASKSASGSVPRAGEIPRKDSDSSDQKVASFQPRIRAVGLD